MRLIDADEFESTIRGYYGNDYFVSDIINDLHAQPTVDLSSATQTLYGYPIEHLEMIARVMAKENCTPEIVAQMLQNAGEIAKMVRDEMLEMLKESIERTCKGVANEDTDKQKI